MSTERQLIYWIPVLLFAGMAALFSACSGGKSSNETTVSNNRVIVERELRNLARTDSVSQLYFDYMYRALAQDSAEAQAKWFRDSVPQSAEAEVSKKWALTTDKLRKEGVTARIPPIVIGILSENVFSQDSVVCDKLSEKDLTEEDLELFFQLLRHHDGSEYFLVNPNF